MEMSSRGSCYHRIKAIGRVLFGVGEIYREVPVLVQAPLSYKSPQFSRSAMSRTDNQSVDRAYRIGQKRAVLVYRLMSCGTVEENIYKMQVIKVNGYEADDVVATLTDQAVQRGHRVVIGSPDKDFKQLISQDVHIVMPLADLGRWSFYTMRHYIEQYKCDPSSDLSLRCIIGDEVDGVPGIQYVAPKFGRKTALKLLRKHGSLANLLKAAAVRTVGKQYAQDALTKHADYLWRNFEVLGLRRYQILELGILKLFLFKSYIPWPFYQSSLYIQWRHGMLEFTFKRIGCWRGILPVIFWCYQNLLICWIKEKKDR